MPIAGATRRGPDIRAAVTTGNVMTSATTSSTFWLFSPIVLMSKASPRRPMNGINRLEAARNMAARPNSAGVKCAVRIGSNRNGKNLVPTLMTVKRPIDCQSPPNLSRSLVTRPAPEVIADRELEIPVNKGR